MSGSASPAAPRSICADCLVPVRYEAAQMLYRVGFRLFARYLETLTIAEADMLHGLGFGILPLIEGRTSGLTNVLGQSVGEESVRRARGVGVPPGVSIVTDLEATGLTSPENVAGYADGVAAVVMRELYQSMLYVGAGQPLTGAELYALRSGPYWCGGSVGIPEPSCGWSMVQTRPLNVPLGEIVPGYAGAGAGDKFDVSIVLTDSRGRTPHVWMP